MPNSTEAQIVESFLAIPAFLPIAVFPGYTAAWTTNLFNFRRLTFVERVFWSLPLSIAVASISFELIGRFTSLSMVGWLVVANSVLCCVTVVREQLELRGSGGTTIIGWKPFGSAALLLAAGWAFLVVCSLVDIQVKSGLFLNVAMLDHGYRVGWIESVLHTGIPPANPLYLYKHQAPLRSYYFWYLLCAEITKSSHLSPRAVFNASCVWAGFLLASLIGLYFKYFLDSGTQLRGRFLRAIGLVAVTGLDICVILWRVFIQHRAPVEDMESWSKDAIISWFHVLVSAPHHVASMVCCMFALLLAWLARTQDSRSRITYISFIALALASAFGLSVYVAFEFFLVVVSWAVWQIAFERNTRLALLLASGGAVAALLLAPFLWELSHDISGSKNNSVFSLAVREMIPPDALIASLGHIAISHPVLTRNLGNLTLLVPGYCLELGFYLIILLIYLIPSWRSGKPLNSGQRSLVFISIATLVTVSFIRSTVIANNDFGWRAPLFIQFPLLLLGSEFLTNWKTADGIQQIAPGGLSFRVPHFVRSLAALAIVIGATGTIFQVLIMRLFLPIVEITQRTSDDRGATDIPNYSYISSLGYAQLDQVIPHSAAVQMNPGLKFANKYWGQVDLLGAGHQMAIMTDQPSCGAEWGGDPSGCPVMAAAIDALYRADATADQAHATCHQLGIQYLVARVYDPVWKSKDSWVWTLRPVVADEEFRAVDCR